MYHISWHRFGYMKVVIQVIGSDLMDAPGERLYRIFTSLKNNNKEVVSFTDFTPQHYQQNICALLLP